MTFTIAVYDNRTNQLLSTDKAEFSAIPAWGDALMVPQLGDCIVQQRQVDWLDRLISLYVVPKAEWNPLR